ncbi:hypothetical protein N7474_003647 [Penicillium riverlandense]|uniref:uncharacterized protein n=1 Tax=Penicillium riverlandense TaxID=1903569 RepID=UPI002547A685|nr:uncharacterized protein N7474_003647 [Penicillium riverlandense]KAJ5818056.1 hypothetical protein N7474_003647 [Penicillium riverlandense]
MAVPQRTLTWLYSVLTKDHYDPQQTYHDPNRSYHDVANALAQYPSLSPRTDVYTYENGFSALLLHLVGTLPVVFRGTTYRFPIAMWIPNTYPRDPPMVYVTPTQDMAVRVGQHVTLEGRVYHHYLAHWAEAWERSTLVDFLLILREVFAKEPPVQYRQQRPPQPHPEQTNTPPPRPPLPPGVGSATIQNQSPPPQPAAQIPPQPPPKPGAALEPRDPQQHQQQADLAERYRSPPPLPPKAQPGNMTPSSPGIAAPPSNVPLPGHVGSSLSSSHRLPPPSTQSIGQTMSPPSHQGSVSYHRNSTGFASPGPGPNVPGQFPYQPGFQGSQPGPQAQPVHQPPGVPHHPPGYQPRPPQQQPPPGPSYPQNSHFPPHYQRPPSAAPAPQPDAPDLLTSPFELDLPSFAAGPAPPIPPNPEKDALLRAVSQALAETLSTNAARSDTAAHSLVSQSQSLHAALATLQGEVTGLNSLHATLQSNTAVLQQSLHRADAAIADAKTRSASVSTSVPVSSSTAATATGAPTGLPPIDEVLVAPTVVGKQLYDLVAEEQGIQQALYALQAALVRGVVGVDSWSRQTRGLAREAFLKRALIRKIGRGMGLESPA